MIEAINNFTAAIAMIPFILIGVGVLITGLVYAQSYFETKRRPAMWRNI